MPFAWIEYIELAQFLCGQSGVGFSTEASDRSAVSRSYYAAYCHARNHARHRLAFQPTYGPSDHGALEGHYRRCRMTSVADKLKRLRQWRNDCDYEEAVSGLSLMVHSAIHQGRQLLNVLK